MALMFFCMVVCAGQSCVQVNGNYLCLFDVCAGMALMRVCNMYMPANGTHVGLYDGVCGCMALMWVCVMVCAGPWH